MPISAIRLGGTCIPFKWWEDSRVLLTAFLAVTSGREQMTTALFWEGVQLIAGDRDSGGWNELSAQLRRDCECVSNEIRGQMVRDLDTAAERLAALEQIMGVSLLRVMSRKDDLQSKSDSELADIIQGLAEDIDLVAGEQTRRNAIVSRQRREHH
jgi:hypothetical protein